jgi:hypothetical protein
MFASSCFCRQQERRNQRGRRDKPQDENWRTSLAELNGGLGALSYDPQGRLISALIVEKSRS